MVSQTVKKLRDTKDNDNDTDVDVDVDVRTDRDTGTGYNSDSLSTIVPKKRNIHFKLSDELVGTFHHQTLYHSFLLLYPYSFQQEKVSIWTRQQQCLNLSHTIYISSLCFYK